MNRAPLVALALAVLLPVTGCKSGDKKEAEAPEIAAWPDVRTKPLAEVGLKDGRGALTLKHAPEQKAATLSLVLSVNGAERELWKETLPLAQRDALWNAPFAAVADPEGQRLAISTDQGKTFRPAWRLADGTWFFDPHLSFPAAGPGPDWSKAPPFEVTAAGILETAVWGCDPHGRGCQSRSLSGGVAHHSEPGTAELLPRYHDEEFGTALAFAEGAPQDRRLAFALVDAALTFQQGLDEAGLKRLGAAAAKAMGDGGPLTPDERKALWLRVRLGRDELKKLPKDQLSPRVSITTLLEAVPSPQ